MFRLQIGGEMLTLRQILTYLTWTFSIQNSIYFFVPAEFRWISLWRAHKALFLCHWSKCLSVYSSNLTCFEKQYQNRSYTTVFSLLLTFFLKDQTKDLTDFSLTEFVCTHGFTETIFINHRPCGSLWNLYRKNWNKSVRVTDDFWWGNVSNVLRMCFNFTYLQFKVSFSFFSFTDSVVLVLWSGLGRKNSGEDQVSVFWEQSTQLEIVSGSLWYYPAMIT